MTIPSSTYRVQLHAGFTFKDLEAILDYLHELGISTIYASPVTTAFKGSQHGYDVTDPLVINPEIGSIDDLERIAGKLKAYGMTWLQDIVPNHMAYTPGNHWLYDALERGRLSECYRYFDIDTRDSGELTGDKIMAPFLGQTLTECLQQGEIKLDFTEKGFIVKYFDNDFPVAAQLYPWIITLAGGYPAALGDAAADWERSISLPAAEWSGYKTQWLRRVKDHTEWLEFIQQRIGFVNGKIALVEELLQNQHYILTHYHLAASRINYRRFFIVNSLICLRMEDEEVFSRYHQQLSELGKCGFIQGLRIDHIDGLAAPREYIEALRASFGKDCYIVAEKILGQDEELPSDWDLQGTTGYEFMNIANQLLTDAGGTHSLEAFYRNNFSEDMPDYPELVFEKKHRFLQEKMGGEWNNLTDLLMKETEAMSRAGWQDPAAAAITRQQLKDALGIFMAAFPVYRIYPAAGGLPEQQQQYLDGALSEAGKRAPQLSAALDMLKKIIGETGFVHRLMQFTGPLAAKGIEDTSFYIYNPLISHNEVGDNPGTMSIPPEAFHQKMRNRLAALPHCLNAGTTHDTKRGEDSRIRLNYLSAIADEWQTAVRNWMRINKDLITEDEGDGRRAPSLNDEYFIYQSLLGGFPQEMIVTDSFRDRFHGFLTKALREADTYTHYDHPNAVYEEKCHAFATAILEEGSAFLDNFIPFAYRVAKESGRYSLSQLLLKLTAPGVPDIYQGSESWELSFVDPDNRRPVDYSARSRMLQEIRQKEEQGWPALQEYLRAQERAGAAKLFVIYRTLQYRNRFPEVFSEGEYIALESGEDVLAYIRRFRDRKVLVAVPLMRPIAGGQVVAGYAGDGGDDTGQTLLISMPDGSSLRWKNLFTGRMAETRDGVLTLTHPFSEFPVLLLTAE